MGRSCLTHENLDFACDFNRYGQQKKRGPIAATIGIEPTSPMGIPCDIMGISPAIYGDMGYMNS